MVLQHALSLVQGSANLIHEIAQLNKLDAGELRFGSGPAPAQQLVPDAVADFINRHPRVQISLDVDNWKSSAAPAPRRDRILRRRHPRLRGRPELPDAPADPAPRPVLLPSATSAAGQGQPVHQRPVQLPAGLDPDSPGIRKLLANLSGKIDFAANIRCENMHALIRIVRQTDAIGIASDETLRPYLQRGELQPLQWRNLPQNLDSLSARCGIISRSGYRLSAAAKAMIETLVELDQAQHAAA